MKNKYAQFMGYYTKADDEEKDPTLSALEASKAATSTKAPKVVGTVDKQMVALRRAHAKLIDTDQLGEKHQELHRWHRLAVMAYQGLLQQGQMYDRATGTNHEFTQEERDEIGRAADLHQAASAKHAAAMEHYQHGEGQAMPSENTKNFEKKVRNNPEDNTLRGAFRDFLEERGDKRAAHYADPLPFHTDEEKQALVEPAQVSQRRKGWKEMHPVIFKDSNGVEQKGHLVTGFRRPPNHAGFQSYGYLVYTPHDKRYRRVTQVKDDYHPEVEEKEEKK